MRLSGFILLISSLITQTLAGGGAPPPPKTESNLDDSKPIHQNLIEQFHNETTKSQDYNLENNKNSKESELMSKLGSITDAHSPTYNQDNPFPRPFWPQKVKFQGKVWATVMFTLWTCILGIYIYIKMSGRDYATLFPEGVEKAKRISQDSGDFLKKDGKRNMHGIIEENESATA